MSSTICYYYNIVLLFVLFVLFNFVYGAPAMSLTFTLISTLLIIINTKGERSDADDRGGLRMPNNNITDFTASPTSHAYTTECTTVVATFYKSQL